MKLGIESRPWKWVLGGPLLAALMVAGSAEPASAQCCSVPEHASSAAAKGNPVAQDSVCVLEISGMTCGACAAHVQKALSGVKGVKEAKVSYEGKKAVVKVAKPSATEKALVKAVKRAGYGARVTEKSRSEPKAEDKKSSTSISDRCRPSDTRACMSEVG